MFMKYVRTDSNGDLYKCPCCNRTLYAKHTVYNEDTFDCKCKENTIIASLNNGKFVVKVQSTSNYLHPYEWLACKEDNMGVFMCNEKFYTVIYQAVNYNTVEDAWADAYKFYSNIK